MLTQKILRDLATAEPRRLVISIHARTDPRDPANRGNSPAWLTAMRNGLSAISDRLERGGDREDRLAFRTLRTRIEQETLQLTSSERARSLTWILDGDGNSVRFSLQLPLRRHRVVLDTKPFVAPLIDVADRGAPAGIILAGGELVRLMKIEQAEVTEPDDWSFALSLGDWRPFGGSAGGSPARGIQTTSHEERYRARVEAQRDQLFEAAATEAAKRLDALGCERVVLVMEGQVATRFRDSLPPQTREQVIADVDFNLLRDSPPAVADAVEPLIEEAWFRHTSELIERICERARSGGAATIGAQETLAALAEGRVHQLVLDPDHAFSCTPEMVPPTIRGPLELIGERAVEKAISTSAGVSTFSTTDSPTLRTAGGMAALLRY